MSRNRLVILLAAFLLIPAAAHAQSTTITACYVPNTGSVYRIKAAGVPDACKKGHVEFSWSAGVGGLSGYQLRANTNPVNAFTSSNRWALCQTGEVPVGGGYLITPNAGGNVWVTSSGPWDPQLNGWVVTLVNQRDTPITVTVYVTCVQPGT